MPLRMKTRNEVAADQLPLKLFVLGRFGRRARGEGAIVNPWSDWYLAQCGEGLKIIQRNMASFEKTYHASMDMHLVSLPSTDLIKEILCCVVCSQIPDPRNFMVCRENGHMICGVCVKAEIKDGALKDSCCSLNNLTKGHPAILEQLLDDATWRCDNWEKGCPSQFNGTEWANHMRACSFNGIWHCYFHNCTNVYASIQQMIDHYTVVHQATIFDPIQKDKTFVLPIKLESLEEKDRILALLKFQGCTFIYGCELKGDLLHIWVWEVDNPILKAMDVVKYSVRLQVSNEKPTSPIYVGTVLPYNEYPPGCITGDKVQSTMDSPQMNGHCVVSAEKLKLLNKKSPEDTVVVLTLKGVVDV